MDPASIRTNNPGAQWYGPAAQAYGATGSIPLPGGNNAAQFPDPVSGAAAQFALLSHRYTNMPLSTAIAKWSGGNSSPAYAAFLGKQTGLSPETVLTKDLLAGPQGLALAKAQAQWEAGKPFPMSDEQWQQAQTRAFGGQQPSAPFQAISAPSAPAGIGLFGSQVPSGPPNSAPPPQAPAGNQLASFFASLPAAPQPGPLPMFPQQQRPNVDMSQLQAFLQNFKQQSGAI